MKEFKNSSEKWGNRATTPFFRIQYLAMAHVLLGALLLLAAGQSINFFSLKQDVEIGSESAKEAEQSLFAVVKQFGR